MAAGQPGTMESSSSRTWTTCCRTHALRLILSLSAAAAMISFDPLEHRVDAGMGLRVFRSTVDSDSWLRDAACIGRRRGGRGGGGGGRRGLQGLRGLRAGVRGLRGGGQPPQSPEPEEGGDNNNNKTGDALLRGMNISKQDLNLR